jgi:uncharacterized protein
MSDPTPIDFGPHLKIHSTGEAAFLILQPSCESLERLPELKDIKAQLVNRGIIFGHNDEAILKLISEKAFRQETTVALCQDSIPGIDASLDYKLSLEGRGAPQIDSEGHVDFKEIGNLIQVKEGAVIVAKIPATMGIEGIDVYGKPIVPLCGKDIQLPGGLNTRILDDGISLVAIKSGYLYRKTGLLCVGEAFTVDRGVNFKTGNIRYAGNVNIRGGVAFGFTVEATGNINIEGEVDGAVVISNEGNVAISGGVFGRGSGKIEAKGEIRLVFAQQCQLRCGSLVVEKFLQDCNVETHNFNASAPKSHVTGGKHLVFGTATFCNLGSDVSQTQVSILDEKEEALRKEKTRLDLEVSSKLPQLEISEKKLRTFKAILAKSGDTHLSPKTVAEIKSAGEAFQSIAKLVTGLKSDISKIDVELARPKDKPYLFRAQGEIQGNVHLDMFHIKKVLGPADSRKEFQVLKDQGLISRPAPKESHTESAPKGGPVIGLPDYRKIKEQ